MSDTRSVVNVLGVVCLFVVCAYAFAGAVQQSWIDVGVLVAAWTLLFTDITSGVSKLLMLFGVFAVAVYSILGVVHRTVLEAALLAVSWCVLLYKQAAPESFLPLSVTGLIVIAVYSLVGAWQRSWLELAGLVGAWAIVFVIGLRDGETNEQKQKEA